MSRTKAPRPERAGTRKSHQHFEYLQNTETGVVFPYTENLSRLPMMIPVTLDGQPPKVLSAGTILMDRDDIPDISMIEGVRPEDYVDTKKLLACLRSMMASRDVWREEADRWRLSWQGANILLNAMERKYGNAGGSTVPERFENLLKEADQKYKDGVSLLAEGTTAMNEGNMLQQRHQEALKYKAKAVSTLAEAEATRTHAARVLADAQANLAESRKLFEVLLAIANEQARQKSRTLDMKLKGIVFCVTDAFKRRVSKCRKH